MRPPKRLEAPACRTRALTSQRRAPVRPQGTTAPLARRSACRRRRAEPGPSPHNDAPRPTSRHHRPSGPPKRLEAPACRTGPSPHNDAPRPTSRHHRPSARRSAWRRRRAEPGPHLTTTRPVRPQGTTASGPPKRLEAPACRTRALTSQRRAPVRPQGTTAPPARRSAWRRRRAEPGPHLTTTRPRPTSGCRRPPGSAHVPPRGSAHRPPRPVEMIARGDGDGREERHIEHAVGRRIPRIIPAAYRTISAGTSPVTSWRSRPRRHRLSGFGRCASAHPQ